MLVAEPSGGEPQMQPPVRVFLSYAWEPDSGRHQSVVREFWGFLRAQGIDAHLDLGAAGQRRDWALWMAEQIRDAEHILVIASPTYCARAQGQSSPGIGRGVQWEARLIRDAFYQDQDALNRFVPVVLPGQTIEGVPDFLAPATTTVYHVRDFTVAGAEPLLRLLTGQSYEIPPLGPRSVLPTGPSSPHDPATGVQNQVADDGRGPTVQVHAITVHSTGSATAASGGYVNAGVHVGDVYIATGAPVATRYHEQVQRIAPKELLDREQELADLERFCTDPATVGQYLWWRATAWSGKSALLSWFVLHPPRGVRIVSFFITARLAGQNDRAAFIENLLEQLLTMLGQPLPPFLTDTTREAHLLGLLADAAQDCRARGEQFVLVVDGLDEDRGAHRGADWHSIANLLPARPPVGMRVIVASRPDPPLPGGVPADHPLHSRDVQRALPTSPHAVDLREQMERDLTGLLRGDHLPRDLLGLVVAAGGGLSEADLVALTGCEPWEVREHLKTVAGRSFTRRGGLYRTDAFVYMLAHEDLQQAACDQFGAASLARYRDRVHGWAQDYRDRHWPHDTPDYLLRGYPDMLAQAHDLSRLVACAIDGDRQKRLLQVSGADGAALAEIVKAIDVCAVAPVVDLNAIARLARHRDRLRDRRPQIPEEILSAWVQLGEIGRAEQIARSVADDDQAWMLSAVAEAIARAGDLHRAEQIARSISEPHPRVQTLGAVARAAAQAGEHDHGVTLLCEAEHVARSITDDPYHRAMALVSVAGAARQAGEHDQGVALLREANRTARSISGEEDQATVLSDVASAAAQAGELEWVAQILSSITHDPSLRAIALAPVAQAVAQAGELDWAEQIARSILQSQWQGSALALVAQAVVQAGEHDRGVALLREAERLTRSITDKFDRALALAELAAVAVAVTGEHDRVGTLLREAEQIARSDNHNRTLALVAVAGVAARAGEHARAEQIARSITDDAERRGLALAFAAQAVVQAGEHDRGVALLHEADKIARSFTDHRSSPVLALSAVAQAVAHAGDLVRAEQIAYAIIDLGEDAWQLAADLSAMVQMVAQAGELGWAERIAHSITDAHQRADALLVVAQAAARAGDRGWELALLHEADRTAHSITDTYQQVDALVLVAQAAARAGDRDWELALLEEAEQAARSFTKSYERPRALFAVAQAAAQAGQHNRAVALLHEAEPMALTVMAHMPPDPLVEVVRAVAQAGEHDRAERIARSFTRNYLLHPALLVVAQAAAKAGQHNRAAALLHEAEQTARSSDQVSAVAQVVAQTGQHDRAERIARSITRPDERAHALVAVAVAFEHDRRLALLREVERDAHLITTDLWQDRVVAAVAQAVAQAGEHDWAERIARSIKDPELQALALSAVSDRVEPERKLRIVAHRLKIGLWYKTSPDLYSMATDAFNEAVDELCGIPGRK